MVKITTSNFQKGIFIKHKEAIHQIVNFQFVNPGKGSAFVRTKLKHIPSGKVVEFTFKSGEPVEEIPVHIKEMQYLYRLNEEYIFMDKYTYEQISINEKIIGFFSQYLKEGDCYQILIYENNAIGMRYPKKVKLKVVQADEAIKGNTVMGAKKLVTLETGVQIYTPLFIKSGDQVFIDPETGEYIERIK